MDSFYSDFIGDQLEDYLSISRKYPHLFVKNGVQEIILDRELIRETEATEYRRLSENGIPPKIAYDWSRAGIVSYDPYVIWIRDAIRQNKEAPILFKRILYTFCLTQPRAVAVCGLTANDEVILIKIWRHALQKYLLEIPRGTPEENESTLECAIREFQEESGYRITQIETVGTFAPDSGILGHEVEVFIARTESKPAHLYSQSEGIAAICVLPLKQVLQNLHSFDIYLNFAISKTKLYG